MSIRRYLVLILLSVITLVTFVAAIEGYRVSMTRASELFDGELTSLAQTLMVITPSFNPSQQQITEVGADVSIAFQLWHDNQLILKTSNAPEQSMSRLVDGQLVAGFHEENFLGQRWRTLVKRSPKQSSSQWVIVAHPMKRRFELAEDVILSAVTPIIITMPLLALLIWFTIARALKPLTHLTQELTSKKADDLSLLTPKTEIKELAPVVKTLNNLFERLDAAFVRERRFASDAAHELRTPLSVLKINIHNIQHESSEKLPSMEHLVQSVDRMAHVVDQILTLNRTNPEQISIESETVDVKAVIIEVINDLYPEISHRMQSISLESDACHLECNKFSMHILMQNLISNASKYTPNAGEILVSTTKDNHNIYLMVEDSGPGINPEEHERVFNRFYRVGGDQHNSSIIGCGLGLAIVKHIAQLHQAKITLSTSAKLKGLKVCISFPIAMCIKNTPVITDGLN